MLLIVLLNAVLAVMIVAAIVALHGRAILTDRQHHGRLSAGESALRPVARATHEPARRAPRATRQPAASL